MTAAERFYRTAGGSMVSAKRWGKTAAASAATETALRERIAREIEAALAASGDDGTTYPSDGYEAYVHAARIARGQA